MIVCSFKLVYKMSVLKNVCPWVLYKNWFSNRAFQIYGGCISPRFCRNESTASKLEGNPYFEKYSKKMTKMKSLDPTEFQTRLENLNQRNNLKKCVEREKKPISKALERSEMAHTRPKKLDDILRMDMVESLPPEEISKLWIEHFRETDGICAIIPSNSYEELYNRSLENSMFLYPLVRGSGYEFIVGQFSGHSCYFTSLANFQVHKDNSPVCLTLSHFPELMKTKKIVLMRGEFDTDILNVTEAQFLANQVQLYYSSADGTKKNLLLRAFNKEPQNFNHTDLITELETLQ